MQDIKISLVLPVHNEEGNLDELYQRSKKVLSTLGKYEIIFVNDGSSDGSLKKIKSFHREDENVKIIDFSRNFGHQLAITAGMDYADGDAVVIMDSDLQDVPEVIPKMVAKWQAGYEVVYAKRRTRKDGLLKKATAYLFYRVLEIFAEIKIPTDTGDFRLMDRKVVLEMRKLGEKTRFVRGLVAWVGFRTTAVFFNRERRKSGNTDYSFRKMVRLAFNGLVAFSELPLKINYSLGAVLLVASSLVLLSALGGGDLAIKGGNNNLLIFLVLFLAGLNFLMLGVQGEYISKISQEVRERPLYIVKKTVGFESEKKN